MDIWINEIPRACTAFSEWISCMLILMILPRQFKKLKFVLISAAYMLGLIVMLTATQETNLFFWWVFMFVAIASMVLFLMLQSGMKIFQCIYLGLFAFLIAEFMASFAWIITALGRILLMPAMLIGPCFIGLNILIAIGIFHLEKSILTANYLEQLSVNENVATTSVVLIIFVFSNVGFAMEDLVSNSWFRQNNITGLFRTFVDGLGIAILYAYQLRIREYMVEVENSSMQALLRSQYEQYRYYQSSMEMIHIKYHDLKHYITYLRAEPDMGKRKEALDRIEAELDENHLVDRTGNQVLDTILGAKIFQGQKIHARFTCVCDGKLLDFIHVTDICTIFGNALDNALEAVAVIDDQEKRLIHLSVRRNKNFVLISVLNYCGDVADVADMTRDNFLKTSKQDKENHGYGVKSIRYTVEKYNGTLNIDRKDGWFGIHILFPIKSELDRAEENNG